MFSDMYYIFIRSKDISECMLSFRIIYMFSDMYYIFIRSKDISEFMVTFRITHDDM